MTLLAVYFVADSSEYEDLPFHESFYYTMSDLAVSSYDYAYDKAIEGYEYLDAKLGKDRTHREEYTVENPEEAKYKARGLSAEKMSKDEMYEDMNIRLPEEE